MNYTKPPKTYTEQIQLFESRGLDIPDPSRAQNYLNRINYFRLSAYWLPYQHTKDIFDTGTTFEHIVDLYLFDRKLRLIVFDAIERIEVAIRAQIIYLLSHKYGTHWQDDASIFVPSYTNQIGQTVDIFAETQNIIKHHCNAKNPEVFIKHYKSKYAFPSNPPSWMYIELLTVGQLSKLYFNLKSNTDKQEISNYFGLHHTVFSSWLHTLTYVRNLCAHHSRLWNKEFAIKPDILLKPYRPWMSVRFSNNNHRCFYFLCILKYLLASANPNNHFKNKLTELIQKYPTVPIKYMGIPSDEKGNLLNWQSEKLWL